MRWYPLSDEGHRGTSAANSKGWTKNPWAERRRGRSDEEKNNFSATAGGGGEFVDPRPRSVLRFPSLPPPHLMLPGNLANDNMIRPDPSSSSSCSSRGDILQWSGFINHRINVERPPGPAAPPFTPRAPLTNGGKGTWIRSEGWVEGKE